MKKIQKLAIIRGNFSQLMDKYQGKKLKRYIIQDLKSWATSAEHLPLLLRGARQVGKTFVIEQLGNEYFKNFLNINFELEPEYIECFHSLKPNEIINALQAMSRQPIIPGETLVFFDEIQNCPAAIMALRYFKEQLPELHLIGAGSLLEFALTEKNFSMPVGRVQFIYLKPLSFQEFLQAQNYDILLTELKTCTFEKPLSALFHQQLLKLVKLYILIGGMPAAIQAYLNTNDFLSVQRMQTVIMSTYRNDFGKYAKTTQHKYLQKIFQQSASIIGQQIKYSKIDPDMRSRDLKQAIELLTQTGVIQPILATAASGIPLAALSNEKKFKLLFLDVGLITRNAGLTANEILNENIVLVNQGALAEQFVGQELLAYADCYEDEKLYFWSRESRGSSAEVGYIISHQGRIIPIEVKAGSTGHLKSLHMLLAEKKLSCGVRISEQPLQCNNNIISLPFYLIGEIYRLWDSVEDLNISHKRL